uniref:Uncharacterized protein n=1 Tax=viral metagenome TaxID=1070528 RepID=A0A6M3IFK2_9ZZZZ
MKKEDILEIINRLKIKYLLCVEKGNWSLMVDIHDEIDRWNSNLKIKR